MTTNDFIRSKHFNQSELILIIDNNTTKGKFEKRELAILFSCLLAVLIKDCFSFPNTVKEGLQHQTNLKVLRKLNV